MDGGVSSSRRIDNQCLISGCGGTKTCNYIPNPKIYMYIYKTVYIFSSQMHKNRDQEEEEEEEIYPNFFLKKHIHFFIHFSYQC